MDKQRIKRDAEQYVNGRSKRYYAGDVADRIING
jgi:hypothetical protein